MQTDSQPFLFASVIISADACQRCFDTGLWLTPRHEVSVCPRVQMREPHREPNKASLLLRRAGNRLFQEQIWIHPQPFDTARILTNYSSDAPCKREKLMDLFFDGTTLTYANRLRKFHAIIEELRTLWLLPVGSRKTEPCGYWIITDLDDYKAWYKRATQAPITQLSTIHRNARHNFPVFAEQMELEFWNDLAQTTNEVKDVLS